MKCTLEESTTEKISPLLEELMKGILTQNKILDSTQKDYLYILMIVSMMENGFSPVNNDLEVVHPSEQMSKWKSPTGVFEATFVMSGFKNISLKLISTPLGAMALVNLVINELNLETYSVCLPVSRYIVSPLATTIPMIFRDLKHFSITFKNKIVSPAKSRILDYHGYPSASLIGLPEELLFKVMLHLTVIDILSVSETCTRLEALLQTDDLWHDIYKRDYCYTTQTEPENWKELYIKIHIARQEKNQRMKYRAAGTMHDYMDDSDFF